MTTYTDHTQFDLWSRRTVGSEIRTCCSGKRKQRRIQTIVGHRPAKTQRPKPKSALIEISTRQPELCVAPTNNNNTVKNASHRQNNQRTENRIKCALLNAQSVNLKTALIQHAIIQNKLDVFVITETWLGYGDPEKEENRVRDNITLNKMIPCGYTFEIKSRIGRIGGGLIIIYRLGIDISLIDKTSDYQSFEHLQIHLKWRNQVYNLVAVYRPPPSPVNKLTVSLFMSQFEDFISTKCLENGRLIILGDLNFHAELSQSPFVDLLSSFGLKQLVDKPTQRSGHTLDLVITRSSDICAKSLEVGNQDISDHSIITFYLEIPRPHPVKKTIRYRKTKDIHNEIFERDLINSGVNESVCNAPTVEEKVSILESKITAVLDKHAPEKTQTFVLRPNAQWFTDDIRKLKSQKRKAEKVWRKTRLTVHREIYETAKKDMNAAISKAKSDFIRDSITDTSNPKELHMVVNNLTKDPKSENSLPVHSDPKDLAERFSSFFDDKINKIQCNFSQQTVSADKSRSENKKQCRKLYEFEMATTEEVTNIISNSPNKSCKLDTIPTWLIKRFIKVLAPAITSTVNASISQSHLPTKFKEALVTPILKKQSLDRKNLQNYRPVSNLNFLSKVIERVVARRLSDHIERNNLGIPFQSAYKKGHSTETTLLRVHNDVINHLDIDQNVALLLLDLSAAFDTVDHGILLSRLNTDFGIDGTALEWIKAYLSQRNQRVVIGNDTSQPSTLKFGVPQGSVLGPLLFTIYTSPLQNILQTSGVGFHLYADDTQIYQSLSYETKQFAIDSIESCVLRVKMWMDANKLKLNGDKTELVVFGKRRSETIVNSIKILGNEIETSTQAKNLGVIFDQHLEMTNHVSAILRSIYTQLRKIGRIRDVLDTNSTKVLVHSLITSRLDFCNSLLYGLPAKTIHRLQVAQNRSARLITKSRKHHRMTPVLRSLHWLPVENRIEYKIACLVYKCLFDQAPDYLKSLVNIKTQSRQLRSSISIQLERPTSKSKFSDRAFTNSAPAVWNSLSPVTRNSPSLPIFKSNLKTELFIKAFELS